MVYAKGSAIIGKHKSIQCPPSIRSFNVPRYLSPTSSRGCPSSSGKLSCKPVASKRPILCPEQKYSFVGMPKTASALLVVPYNKFPTNKPSPLSFPCPESDESLASNASASFLASTEDTLSSLLSNSLTRIRVYAIESFYYSKWMLSLLLWNSSFLLSLISLITIEYRFLTLCLCSLCSSSTLFSRSDRSSFKRQK